MSSHNRQNLKAIVNLLRNNPDGLTSEQIAKHINATRQTAYNNIKQLEQDGYAIYQSGALWCLDAEKERLLHLSLEEAWLLYLPLRRIIRAQLHRYPLVHNLLNKVTELFREPDIAEQLIPTLTQQPEHNISDNFSQLVDAWRKKTLVSVGYRKLNATQKTELIIAPYWFEPAVWTDGFYLIAGVEQRNGTYASLTLKLERIHTVKQLAATFERPPINQLTAQVAETWGIWQGDQVSLLVTLRFHNRQYDRLRETRWHPSEKITLEKGGSVIWQGYVSEPQEMMPWIRSWGADVEVLEPLSIREQIANEASATAHLYNMEFDPSNKKASKFF